MNKRLLSGLAALVMVFSGTAALPAGTFEGIDISASAAGNVDPNTYYLVGTMSGWGPKSDYAFVPVRLGLYVVKNVELSADDEFKGALTDSYCEFTDDNWYPGGMGNNVKAPEAGVYTIYFRPAGDGDEKDGFDVLSENDSRRMFKFVKEDTGTIGGTCGENLTWALDDDGTLTISGTGKMYNFGESIDATGPQPWLDHKDEIKKVVVADGVTSIGSDAFYYLPNLESAELPDSVTSIGSFAFSYSEKLKSVDLPSKLKKIDYYVFSNCTSLESITIPDRVTTIEPGAFRSCTSLKNVTVPNSVTAIGEKAFGYYDDMFEGTDLKLKDFTISGGKGTAAETYAADNEITFIPVDEPENVASGKCGEDVSWALAEDGTLTIKGSGYMTDYEVADAAGVPWSKYVKKIKKVVIFDGVTSIGAAAFYKCQKLESVDIPDTVMDIGDFAFALCSSLKKIELPDSLFGIGGFSFYGCAKLEGVTIPDSVMHIDMGAFSNCTGIKSVTIPKNVTRIGSYAFGYSYDFETFNAVKDEDFTMIGYKKTDAETYAADNGFEFTALDAASIINLGVCGENLTWTLESDGLLTISGMGDMYDYDLSLSPWYDDRDEIKNVEIGNGVTNIGSDAFAFCSNIESVIIPYGVTSIGSSAFSLCSEITEINIPDSVMTIGDHAFMGCTGIKDLTLGKSVMSIGKGAFYACMGLESITIPYSVTSIGDEAFTDCAELKNVTIPDSVTEIGKQALGYYTGTNDKLVKFKDFTITGYKDTAAEKYAADNGFEFVAITGEEAVDSGVCGENLTWKIDQKGTLTISGTGDMDDMSAICPWYEHYYDIRKVVIEDGVTSIGAGAFAYCTELESVTIPDSVKSVGAQAFNLCTSLAGVTIPDSVTSIGDQAFNCCMSLNSVTIGNGVKSIGEKAFYECYELIDVAVPDSVESIGSQALGYYHNYDNNEEEKTEGFTIAGSKNTAAEKYAADNGFAFSAAEESVFGDINGDKILNVNDLVLMQKIVAGWDIEYDKQTVDLNGDKKISVHDLILMQKLVAGWKVDLTAET